MSGVMQIPPINETRFLPLPVDLSNTYNYYQFDRQFDYLSRLWFQQKRFYKQRKQVDDFNCVQVNSNLTSVELQIRDRVNNIIATISPTTTVSISGLNYQGNALTTYQWIFKLQDVLPGFTGSCYYVVKGVTPVFSETEYYPSEAIWVKEKWEETLQIRYNHNKNLYAGAIFSTNPLFSIRVDGYPMYDGTDAENTEFEDQNNANVNLNTYTQRKFRLEIGGYVGVPRYLIDKLVYIFGCRYLTVEDFPYSIDNGAKLEWDNSDTAAAFNCSIVLQEADPVSSYSFMTERTVRLMPLSFPAFLLDVGLFGGGTFMFVESGVNPTIIEDLTDAATKVTTWNGLLAGFGLTGSVVISATGIDYALGQGEQLDPISNVLYKNFTVLLRLSAASATFTPKLKNVNQVGIDWGGSVQVVAPNGTPTSVPHTFGNGGVSSNPVRFFHNDTIGNFTCDVIFNTALVISVTGVMSSLLDTFIIKTMLNTTTTFDMETLKYAKANLRSLTITGSGLTTILDPFIYSGDVTSNFPLLTTIDLGNNKLTVSTIDNFVTNLVQLANYSYNAPSLGKNITMDNQTPAAPPAGPTVVFITELINSGWNVAFD